MRIWDVSPKILSRQSLLGEHRELHGLINILIYNKKGYSRHPETLRWVGKEHALYKRHQKLVKEMVRRGYKHNSPIHHNKTWPRIKQDIFVNTIEEQHEILAKKYNVSVEYLLLSLDNVIGIKNESN
jgi:hypothetical protein